MDKTRAFLERNRIFFETIAASLLSVMAIIISAAQVSVAFRQNSLIELQTQIAQQQVLPQIQIDTEISLKKGLDGREYIDEERLAVNGFGGVARSPSAKTALFLDITVTPEDLSSESITKSFALNGYYQIVFTTNSGVGKLIGVVGPGNAARFAAIEREINDIGDDTGYYITLDLRRYLKLAYQDVFGANHVEYYAVSFNSGGFLLPENEGADAFQAHSDALHTGNYFELTDLTAQELLNRTLPP